MIKMPVFVVCENKRVAKKIGNPVVGISELSFEVPGGFEPP